MPAVTLVALVLAGMVLGTGSEQLDALSRPGQTRSPLLEAQ